jgi:hypothetical protein
MTIRRFERAAALSFATLALSFAPSFAHAAKGSVTISHAAPHIDGAREDLPYFVSIGGGRLEVGPGAGTNRCFVAGLNLPQGAKPTALQTWVTSNVEGGVSLTLMALDLPSGTTTRLVEANVGDNSGKRKQITQKLPTGIQRASVKTAYGLGFCLNSGDSFSGARVDYTID